MTLLSGSLLDPLPPPPLNIVDIYKKLRLCLMLIDVEGLSLTAFLLVK